MERHAFGKWNQKPLLDLDLCACGFELLLDLLSLVLAGAFLDGLGRAFDEILGFFEAEVGDLTNGLDDLDLVRAAIREDDVELGFLFGRGCSSGGAATSTTSHGDGS